MIGVRVSEREYDRVRQWAEARGMNVTAFVRQAIETMIGGPIEPAEYGEFEVGEHTYAITSTEWVRRRSDRDETRCLLVRIQRGSDQHRAVAVLSMSGVLEVSIQREGGSPDHQRVERLYVQQLPALVEEIFAQAAGDEGRIVYHVFTTDAWEVFEQLGQGSPQTRVSPSLGGGADAP